MKQFYTIIAICALLCCFSFHAKAQLPRISITDFKTTTFDHFNDKDGKEITQGVIESSDGFELNIDTALKITGIGLRSKKDGGFNPGDKPKAHGSTSLFTITTPFLDATTYKLEIALYHKNNPKPVIITLIVKKGEAKQPIIQKNTSQAFFDALFKSSCPNVPKVSTKSGSTDCSTVLSAEDNFGELVANYTKDKITYVYDYRIKTWYKIKKNKNGEKLDRDVVSLGRESLGPYAEVQLKVVNVNKFRFDVNSTGYFSAFDSQPPALYNQFFIGGGSVMESMSSAFTNGLANAQDADGKQNSEYFDLLLKIRCFLDKYNGYNAQVLQAWNPCSTFPCCQEFDYHGFVNELMEIRFRMAKLQADINDAKTALAKTTKDVDACEKTNTDLTAVKKDIADLGKKKEPLADADKKKLDELKAKETTLTGQQCPADTLARLKKVKEDKENKVKEFSSITDLSARLPSEATIFILARFINEMVTSETVYSRTYPMVKGDRYNETIYIKSRDSLLKYIPFGSHSKVNDTISFEIPIIRKPMVTFSSGSFIALNKGLKNKTYDWQQVGTNGVVSDTSKYRLAESGYSAPVMGFSALGNVEWRLYNSFGIGGSAGVGLTIEKNPRPSYLIGFSFFVGSEKQFVTTVGYSGMQVNVLKNNLQAIADQKIQYSTNTKPAIEYYKALKGSLFVSISFTPFTVVKR